MTIQDLLIVKPINLNWYVILTVSIFSSELAKLSLHHYILHAATQAPDFIELPPNFTFHLDKIVLRLGARELKAKYDESSKTI